MIQRRGFLAGLLALGAAPAIVTSKGFLSTYQPIAAMPSLLEADYIRQKFIDALARRIDRDIIKGQGPWATSKSGLLLPGDIINIRKPPIYTVRNVYKASGTFTLQST